MKISASQKKFLKKWFIEGQLIFLGRPLYKITLAIELAVCRFTDFLKPAKQNSNGSILEELTIIIKTFERPKILHRLVDSIRRLYPDLQIIVTDDSRQPIPISGVQTFFLPYNCGISQGRQEALKHVKTKYVLVVDDDYIFYRRTQLLPSLLALEKYPEIDIIGGERVDLPFFTTNDYSDSFLFPSSKAATWPAGTKIGGLPVYNKVANFFIARTERIRTVGWDARFKRRDHADFFSRAKGLLTTVFNADMKCLHAKTFFDSSYMNNVRKNILNDRIFLEHKSTQIKKD